ncbi:PQQ-dependent sugar dehydrogenase [Compostibacter hankyongensis]|uniref:DUF7133 domain-containing protein n=1 Tax=Compostibacter hankyongensis TaxID=1007089 RepID=A0ABP8G9L4_9BACT
MKPLFICIALIAGMLLTCCKPATQQGPSYRVESIALPPGLGGQVGGLDFLPDGRLAACFSSGEVMFYDPRKKTWQLFATGLHDPLGILAEDSSSILVMQRPELTRLKDSDGDGQADLYETVTDDFGISGNYHEFAYGPVKDSKGNLFIALNSSSPNGGVMKTVRGPLNSLTMDHPKQMFSPVPYRGWIMEYTPGGKLLPYASGFRSPNGIGFDPEGNLFATDNQGDWVPTSALYQIQKGKFYGHPASLAWEKGWDKGNPLKLSPAYLDSLRARPAVLFPHGIMANSPTQPLADNTGGKFGPFSGQLFVGEMNQARILRVMPEQIDGQWQGACIPFFDGHGLHKGNNRLAFAPDGSLWVGQNNHGWAGDTGIQRIVFTGTAPMNILRMHLVPKGFVLSFTRPLDRAAADSAAHYQMRHYRYHYSSKYGSAQFDVDTIPVTGIRLSRDRKKVMLTLDSIIPDMVYELTLTGIRSESGIPLSDSLICYTVNRTNPEKNDPDNF